MLSRGPSIARVCVRGSQSIEACLPERRAGACLELRELGELGRGGVALGPLEVVREDLRHRAA